MPAGTGRDNGGSSEGSEGTCAAVPQHAAFSWKVVKTRSVLIAGFTIHRHVLAKYVSLLPHNFCPSLAVSGSRYLFPFPKRHAWGKGHASMHRGKRTD